MSDIGNRRAIVLAAGLGRRMRPLTDTLPKPLIKVGGKCLIDHALDFLAQAGLSQAVVNTHYMAEKLVAHLAARTQPAITLSHEEHLLETGGGIVKALPMLGDRGFFAINSDTICLNGERHALHRLLDRWDDVQMDALLLVHPVTSAVGYHGAGDFFLEDDDAIIRRGTHMAAPYVFTGIQILHPRLFADAPMGAFSLNVLYDRAMDQHQRQPRIKALLHDGKWLHVGDPSAIPLAEAQLEAYFGSR